MDKESLEVFGTAILGFFFGIYNEKALEDTKQYLGRYIIEHGGVEKAYNELCQHSELTDVQKQEILKNLNECVQLVEENDLFTKKVRKL